MSEHYILIGQTPIPVEPCDPSTPEGVAGLLDWARWFEVADRRVSQTTVLGLCWVSTVFFGLDHEFRNFRLLQFGLFNSHSQSAI
jgi:hypothetical protein